MDLRAIQDAIECQHRAPTEKWNPPYCGDIDLVIRADGRWCHEGTDITRPALIKLFASVLVKESEQYFLVTPAEKIGIQVEDLPFLITGWDSYQTEEKHALIWVETNIGERYLLGREHPLISHQNLPALIIRDELLARVHRNVYYQWSDIVQSALPHESAGYYIQSGTERFKLD
ncbi:MAG: protein of unknown function DUF1285 [Idiomarinaceae bacterium HL-53]|nr:MAG: protein of unknown function DUF1285 [Idiomarinaceae bacterium HL-53]CUS48395.1 hypothetical protein Ga0003345_1343 [Idiomarinaceae bacterium HL-53]